MKRLRFEIGPLDATDTKILTILTVEGRIPMSELARRIGLSAPSAAERVRRLEEVGIIEGYEARINPAAVGFGLSAYLRIRPVPGQLGKTTELVAKIPQIVECDRVTGEDCLVARVHVRSVAELEAVIDRIVPYAMTNTSLIQSQPVRRQMSTLLTETTRS